MGTIVSYQTTGEPLLLTGTANVTDMTFKQLRQMAQIASSGQPGVMAFGDMKVTDGGAGAVNVAAGYAWVKGTVDTSKSGQYLYGVPLDTAKVLNSIPSPASSTRRDLIVCRVYDEGDAPGNGGLNEGRIQYIVNATESLTPEAAPANSYVLAYCDVTTGGAKTITDRRWSMPIPGRELIDGFATITADTSQAIGTNSVGTTIASITVNGDGVTPVELEAQIPSIYNSLSGAGYGLMISDTNTPALPVVASGSGAGIAAFGFLISPGVNYRDTMRLWTPRYPPFSGPKTFYLKPWVTNAATVGITGTSAGSAPAGPTLQARWHGPQGS